MLCDEWKEEMTVAFYKSNREKALQWRPERHKPCKYFKMDSIEPDLPDVVCVNQLDPKL